MRRKLYCLILIICFFILSIGVLTVTSTLPKAIKENSSYKISFSLYPFNFEFKNDKYVISAGRDTINAAINGVNTVKSNITDLIEQFRSPVK